jgi:asparagine synthetase B (glutamine-hydrolysing)
MPGLFGVFPTAQNPIKTEDLLETINLGGAAGIESWQLADGFMAVAALGDASPAGPHHYQDERYLACLAGDLVGVDKVPWTRIISALESENPAELGQLRGIFGIAVVDRSARRLYLVSDRRAQLSLCYAEDDKGFVFSTSMATFCRLPVRRPINAQFLYETMFFNFPIGGTTFLDGVTRLGPASVLRVDLATRKVTIRQYAARFKRAGALLGGRQALEHGRAVLSERLPAYFGDGIPVALGLSGGADSRLLLSLCPPSARESVRAYTYGIEGCVDRQEASALADTFGVSHREVDLGDEFLDQLSHLMQEAVYLGAGGASVVRSTLLYVYSKLTEAGSPCRVAMSGTCMNQILRGRFPIPAGVSRNMARVFIEGSCDIDDGLYGRVFGKRFDDFSSHIQSTLRLLEDTHGDFRSGDCHLAYHVYEYGPKYCAAEMGLINEFAVLRVPALDDDVISLAHEIEFSTLVMSSFIAGRVSMQREYRLYAHILAEEGTSSRMRLKGYPLSILRGPGFHYGAYRVLSALSRRAGKAFGHKETPLTNWSSWLTSGLGSSVDDILLSDQSLIIQYLERDFIADQLRARNAYWISKILTAELILRMHEQGWRRLNVILPA